MRTLSHFGISTRSIRRKCFPYVIRILPILLIIVCLRSLLNSFPQSSLTFNTNTTQHDASRQVPNNQQSMVPMHTTSYHIPKRVVKRKKSTDDQVNQISKQKLSLIHQPPSKSIVLRALLLFYPNDQELDFLSEFRWFYRSWIEMMRNESALWRTDLIVYASEYTSFFQQLDCVYNQIRINSDEKPKCRVFPYVRIKNRASNHEPSSKYQVIDTQHSQSLYQYLRIYGYIDSINTVFEYYLSFAMYDFILRTDMDCFITQNFALYVPYNNSVLVGHGGYSTEFNNKRLKRIAHDMNWQYADKNSLGSTWYGPPSMIHRMADCTIQAMLYVVINEFTTPEKEGKLGVMLWPEWHFGVLLLYGGHLAINHLIASEKFHILLADQLLDQGTTSKDKTDMKKNLRLHLHCWHTNDPFSKFQFKAGKYNQTDLSTLVSDTSASGYAMRIALESKLMTVEQLKQKLLDAKK